MWRHAAPQQQFLLSPTATSWTLHDFRNAIEHGGDQVTIALGGTIGVGLFLFHTFAHTGAELADIVPFSASVLS